MMDKYLGKAEDENFEIYTGFTYGKIEIIEALPINLIEIARLAQYQYVVQSQLDEINTEATHFKYENELFSQETIIAFYKKI